MTARLLALVDRATASRPPRRAIPSGWPARWRSNVPDALQVSRTLKARDFVVDYRPPVGIRISPHFYNTMDEIDRIMGGDGASIVAKWDYAAADAGSRVT